MSQEPSPELPEKVNVDSRLRAFLRRAGPVIASERGMTEGARVKLRSIASDMNLPNEMFEQALATLQNEPPVIKRELSRYEVAFERSMRSKLQKIPNGILTAKIESRAVEIAKEKYQLDDLQAREILRSLVGELKLRRISVTQSERHMEATIEDLIGDQTYATEDARVRLIEFGKGMGLPKEHVEAMIRHYVDLNLLNKKNEGTLIKVVAACLAVTVLIIGGLVVWSMTSDPPVEPETDSAKTNIVEEEPLVIKGEFWDDELMLAAMGCARLNSNFARFHRELADSDPAKRRIAYEQLVQKLSAMATDKTVSANLATVIQKLIQLESNEENARFLVTQLTDSLTIQQKSLPVQPEIADQASLILDSLVQVKLENSASSERSNMVGEELFRLTGKNPRTADAASARNEYLDGWFESQLQRLSGMVAEQPTEVINSHFVLFNASNGKITDSRRLDLRLGFVQAALESAPDKWQALQPATEWVTRRARSEQLVRLISIYESLENFAAQKSLGSLLVDAIGIPNSTNDPAEIAKSFRRKLGVSEPLKVGIQREREQFNENARKLRISVNLASTDTRELTNDIAKAAYWTTFASYVRRGDIESDAFKALVALGPPDRLTEEYVATMTSELPEEDTDSDDGSRDKTVDQAKLEQTLRPVSENFKAHNTQKRVTALRDLAIIAKAVDDAPPQLAVGFARYLLTNKKENEQREAMVALRQSAHWPSLMVGVADTLSDSDQSDEQLEYIAREFLDDPAKLTDKAGWIKTTRVRLLDQARQRYEQLADKPAVAGAEKELDFLQTVETAFTRQRAFNFGVAASAIREGVSLETVLRSWYLHLIASGSMDEASTHSDAERQLSAAGHFAQTPPQRIVLHQQLLLDQLQRGPFSSAVSSNESALRRLNEIEDANDASVNVFQQMLCNEMKLLEMMLAEK